jgi:hypothetical protein
MLTFKLQDFTDKATLLILALLYTNLFSTCIFTISCSSYLPTLSYSGTFRTHDQVFVLALTLFAFTLLPLFISWHVKTQTLLSLSEALFLVFLETGIIVLTITVGLIDEINGIEFNPVDNLHHFLVLTLCFITIIWIYYGLSFLKPSPHNYAELHTCWFIYKLGLFFYVLTLYQWHFAYTIYSNALTNPFIEAISEWILITLTIRFPFYLAKSLKPTVTISLKTSKANN